MAYIKRGWRRERERYPQAWEHKEIWERDLEDIEALPLMQRFSSYDDLKSFSVGKLPKKKPYKHVVLDADETIWNVRPWGRAMLCTPTGMAKRDVVTASSRAFMPDDGDIVPQVTEGSITLLPNVREMLDKLRDKGIGVSIASLNPRGSIMQIVDAFNLGNRFSHVEAEIDLPKSEMVANIARKEGINPSEILFVDDNPINVHDVKDTGAATLLMDMQISDLMEILDFIE